MSIQKQYGIKFPFNIKSLDKTFVDLDKNEGDSVRSQIMHLIFTPIGQRLRKPLFGSKLIQYIFNPNDSQNWNDIIREIKDMIKSNIPNCSLDDINIYTSDDGIELIAEIKYSVSSNNEIIPYKIITKL